jgi:hypothetical protein
MPAQLKPRSYTVKTEDGKPDIECDAYSCKHCNMIVLTPVKRPDYVRFGEAGHDIGGYCPMCHANICGKCADEMGRTLKCVPLEKKLEKMERRDALLKAAGVS